MKRTMIVTFIYLLLALALEVAILPQFFMLVPPSLSGLLDLRLLALAGILIGLLRGEIQGMIVALIAACLLGFSQPLGNLGSSMVSFCASAYLAGLLARRFLLYGTVARAFFIGLLLVIERLIAQGVRRLFWPEEIIKIPWTALLITVLIGVILHGLARPKLKVDLMEEDLI